MQDQHLSHPDDSFGPQLLQMCNQALFECLALNLHCLRGDQRALTAVINHRIVSTQSHKNYSLFVSVWNILRSAGRLLLVELNLAEGMKYFGKEKAAQNFNFFWPDLLVNIAANDLVYTEVILQLLTQPLFAFPFPAFSLPVSLLNLFTCS